MNGLLDGALTYAERGWHVIPVHGIANGRCTCGVVSVRRLTSTRSFVTAFTTRHF